MSGNANTNTKEDVDRLFECFKCGISPPASAMREKKRSKSKLNKEDSTCEVSASVGMKSPVSAGGGQANAAGAHLCMEKSGSAMVTDKFNHRTQISPVVFYGSPHGVPPKRPLSLLRLLREIHVDLKEQSKSTLSEVWATFPRQEEAMKFAKGNELLRIFSYQDHFNGQRRYLASTYKEFWKRYQNMDSKYRHHYEVVQEGLPCHLYFDLEFNKGDNVGKDGDEMVDLLIAVTLEALLEKYSIEGNHDWVVELDSSTADKFSRHLIVRIPETAFKDNSHTGAFVAEICSRIVSTGEGGRFGKLFIKKDSCSSDLSSHLFVDTAVYSRNRCFRLPLSSKAGKTSVLLPTGRFKCNGMHEEDMFMASLICNMDVDCEKFLVCKMELECVKTLQFDTEVNHNIGRWSSSSQEFQLNASTSDVPSSYLMGKSPFPVLDHFIESIATIGNVSGKIRCWYWFSEYGLIVYSMLRNRYCARIGRQHKSNHVMYVVDLGRAVYYQKCHDPDCRGYRSPLCLVPMDIIPDPSCCFGSGQTGHHKKQINNFKDQFVYTEQELGSSQSNNGHSVECSSKKSWWLEAVKVADDLESKPKELGFINMEITEDEDDGWWMAAEWTLSQAELTHSN
ncbi:DNA-directed primase/polymerase protein isoform X2 [Carica papaya]|uniref:DNA-directed primase/polymerase protein isoform X2 n=1 Tax=Carica papaya TaxID=3649 RepID=UPI000B8CDF3C|nr:DNA-directed primase/polymerase protein isoform X2 [Carica papaya]